MFSLFLKTKSWCTKRGTLIKTFEIPVANPSTILHSDEANPLTFFFDQLDSQIRYFLLSFSQLFTNFIHSFIEQIFTELLPHARQCSMFRKYEGKQGKQGLCFHCSRGMTDNNNKKLIKHNNSYEGNKERKEWIWRYL